MKILLESTVVESRKEGKWTYYSLSETGCEKARQLLRTMLETSDDYKKHTTC